MQDTASEIRIVGDYEPFVVDSGALHVESSRALVFWLGDWDVRMSEPGSNEHRLLVVNGMFHIQLWHPEARLSVLTPSPLTDHQFEVANVMGNRFRTDSYDEMAAVVQAARHVKMPGVGETRDVFFAMCTEFLWPISGAILPSFRFSQDVAAK